MVMNNVHQSGNTLRDRLLRVFEQSTPSISRKTNTKLEAQTTVMVISPPNVFGTIADIIDCICAGARIPNSGISPQYMYFLKYGSNICFKCQRRVARFWHTLLEYPGHIAFVRAIYMLHVSSGSSGSELNPRSTCSIRNHLRAWDGLERSKNQVDPLL